MVRKLRLKVHPAEVEKVPPVEGSTPLAEGEDVIEETSAGGEHEDEFGVYNISELNVADSTGKESSSYKVRQTVIGLAIALLLIWLVWPAGEETPAPAKSVVEEEEGRAVAEASGERLTVMLSIGNVRSKPSAGADVLFQLEKDAVVTKLDTKWGWHQIRLDDGRTGWAYQSLFMEPEPAPADPEAKAAPDGAAANEEGAGDSEPIKQPEDPGAAQQ
ncbi:SH3 domain-containing protein [Mariprofundus aestuarium]|uniref:SH3 domain-containing protein n=1 Tax=Mariprofundus aestuarium TaxID=1921086 RepID=A0A2K8KWA2_MARES|nr:SH3 domain-containing protein [Mariprofundus aestuarium]ATX79155.1 SH3 domain-containing protein [Mariprofundus aestuarium]